jgi:hypothetical protein
MTEPIGTYVSVIDIVRGIDIVHWIVPYMLNRQGGPSLVYRSGGARLLGGLHTELPPALALTVCGVQVRTLTKSILALWNDGATTIRGTDIVDHDPLRIECVNGGRILYNEIARATRPANRVELAFDESHPGSLHCWFDYLDQGDGVIVELWHTGVDVRLAVRGSVRGLPNGVTDGGDMRGQES